MIPAGDGSNCALPKTGSGTWRLVMMAAALMVLGGILSVARHAPKEWQ